jgi:predicted aldo/keto reductase-like oxidoreductase
MIYNKYGKSGIKISAISCGGMRFEKPEDTDAAAELVKKIHSVGINYFDTAPGYTNSEQIFGKALPEIIRKSGRESFYISTKTSAETPSEAKKDLETSLSRMNLSYIDFYHLWCVMDIQDYETRKKNGVLKIFEQLKDEGLIKHICISTHMSGDDIKKVIDDYDFEGILLGYSAMNFNYRERGLDAASSKGLGVIAMNPLGGGVIPQNPKLFSFLKTQKNETIAEAAIRFLLNDDRITSSLIGFSNESHLNEAISAIAGFKKISESKKKEIRKQLKVPFNELCTACGYCDSCPQNIPIPKMMDAFNHCLIEKDSRQAVINRFKWHWRLAPDDELFRKCVKCGKCEKLCTQKLPIIKRLEIIREIMNNEPEKK